MTKRARKRVASILHSRGRSRTAGRRRTMRSPHLMRERRGAKPRTGQAFLALATLAAWGAIFAPHADSASTPAGLSDDQGILSVLCGLVPALDVLLGCKPPTPSPGGDAPATTAPPPSTSGSPPPVVAGAGIRPAAPTPRFAPDLLLVTFKKDVTRPQ